MGRYGMGVMINMLKGNAETVEAMTKSYNKIITSVELNGDNLVFEFEDGSKLKMWDDGQTCCERRYMTTDDDLAYFVGAKLIGAEIKDAPNMPDEYGDHEVQFLEIQTDRGVFTMASHNEHNGYYGGFSIEARTYD